MTDDRVGIPDGMAESQHQCLADEADDGAECCMTNSCWTLHHVHADHSDYEQHIQTITHTDRQTDRQTRLVHYHYHCQLSSAHPV